MSAEIINLRRVRRAKDRVSREALADARRLEFGRTKADKSKQAAERDKALRLIDGHKRDSDTDKA